MAISVPQCSVTAMLPFLHPLVDFRRNTIRVDTYQNRSLLDFLKYTNQYYVILCQKYHNTLYYFFLPPLVKYEGVTISEVMNDCINEMKCEQSSMSVRTGLTMLVFLYLIQFVFRPQQSLYSLQDIGLNTKQSQTHPPSHCPPFPLSGWNEVYSIS